MCIRDRYLRGEGNLVEPDFLEPKIDREVKQICKIINAFYGWDHNSCEVLLTQDKDVHPIDFANAYPDSSLVSLHYYFPELVKNTVRWLLFIVCTDRKKKIFGHDWNGYYEILERAKKEDVSYQQKLDLYEELADLHYSTRDFYAFYEQALGVKFERACYEFFASEEFEGIIEEEVSRYFKIPSEKPAKIEQYKNLHKIWLDQQAT